MILLIQDFPSNLEGMVIPKASLNSKDQGKNSLRTLAFSVCFATRPYAAAD